MQKPEIASAQNAAKKIAESQKDLTWIVGYIKHLRRIDYHGDLRLRFRGRKIVKHFLEKG